MPSDGRAIGVLSIVLATLPLMFLVANADAVLNSEAVRVVPRPGVSQAVVHQSPSSQTPTLAVLRPGQSAQLTQVLTEYFAVAVAGPAPVSGFVSKKTAMLVSSSGRELTAAPRPSRHKRILASVAGGLSLCLVMMAGWAFRHAVESPPSEKSSSTESDHPPASASAPLLPVFDYGYQGYGGELLKRFQMRQVVKTIDRQVALNERHLVALDQVRRLEEGKLEIVRARHAQLRAQLEHDEQVQEMGVRSHERLARTAQAKLARTKAEQEAASVLNPPQPSRPPSPAERIRQKARRAQEELHVHLAMLNNLEEWEAKELAKAPPSQASFIKELFRRMKDNEREGLQ